MKQGVFAAVVVSLVWIILQNLLMFVRPAENRFKAMLTGYILSLPFVFFVYRWLTALRVVVRRRRGDRIAIPGTVSRVLLPSACVFLLRGVLLPY